MVQEVVVKRGGGAGKGRGGGFGGGEEPKKTLFVGLGCEYPEISAAVSAARAGDTIEIRPGRYLCNLKISKSLIIKGGGGGGEGGRQGGKEKGEEVDTMRSRQT